MEKPTFWKYLKINHIAWLFGIWAIFNIYLFAPSIFGDWPPFKEDVYIVYGVLIVVSIIWLVGSWKNYKDTYK